MAPKKPVKALRCCAGNFVAAKPNRIANTTSARIALSAAAATMFGGSSCCSQSDQLMLVTAVAFPWLAPAMKASAVARSMGHSASRPCVSRTASVPATSSRKVNQPMARDASRPVAIASETLATAATSIENTSGPTVMRSALSQSVPIASMPLAIECASSPPE